MAKSLLFLTLLVFMFLGAGRLCAANVEGKDWPEYFPDIARHPSGYEGDFFTVDTACETPHTKWAKPYYGGRIRVLAIAPRVCQRDTVELAQRLDMELVTFNCNSYASLGGSGINRAIPFGMAEAEQIERLSALLAGDYDVIILGGMLWSAFPLEIQDGLLGKTQKGAGLVIATMSNPALYIPPVLNAQIVAGGIVGNLIGHGVPFLSLKPWSQYKTNQEAQDQIILTGEYGKGKVVVLKNVAQGKQSYFVPSVYEKNPSNRQLWEVDYYCSLAARAVAWAAGRAPDGDVNCKMENGRLNIQVSKNKQQWDSLQVAVRDDWGEVVYAREGQTTVYELLALAGGNYVADVIVRQRGRSVNWGSTAFQIKKEPVIRTVEVNPRAVKPGDALMVRVVLSSSVEADAFLEVKIEDMRGRLIGNVREKIVKGQEAVEMPVKGVYPLSNLMRVRAFLTVNDAPYSCAEIWVPVKLAYPRDNFGFVIWDEGNNQYVWHYARKVLADLGVDIAYTWESGWAQSWVVAQAGFQTIPYVTRYGIDQISDGPYPERIPCLSNPEYISKEQDNLAKLTDEAMIFGPVAYSLGDENNLSTADAEVCFSKHCRAGFREYVKTLYNNLEALNKEWNVSYASWDEIEPLPLGEARKNKQPARWVDFRMFMENVFCNIHKAGAETVQKKDPDALVGFDGALGTTSLTGYDWWKLSRVLGLWVIYPDHLQTEILRSFHEEGTRSGRWYGGYNNITRFEEYAHWEPWYVLFHELNSIWWWSITGGAGGGWQSEATVNVASMKPFPILKATSDEALSIKAGIDKLLLGCRRDSGEIAILYSQPSLHAAAYYKDLGNPNDSEMDFIKVLEDLGYQYRFVSYEQVKDGILNKTKYRLLILPGCMALSNEERERIKAFVAMGGKVVFDGKAGAYDEHGKAVEDTSWTAWLCTHGHDLGVILRGYKRDAHFAPAARNYFRDKLATMGIAPEFTLLPDKGEVYEGELAVFTDGEVRYLGLLRDHSPTIKKQTCCLVFPAKVHVYDVRKGCYVGFCDRIHVDLKPGMAGLWALLPNKAAPLRLHMAEEAKTGETMDFSIELDSPYRSVVHIDVFDPENILQKHYCRNLTVSHGHANGMIPFALNDKKGCWAIKAKDVATGISVTKKIDLR